MTRLPPAADVGKRCAYMEQAVSEAAVETGTTEAACAVSLTETRQELQRFISRRKDACGRGYRIAVAFWSRQIHREATTAQRRIKRETVRAMFQEYRGLEQIAGILEGKKPSKMTSIKDKHGKEHTDPQSMVDCFAEFYEALYDKRVVNTLDHGLEAGSAPTVTGDEVRLALTSMKNGKTKDNTGIVAEMLKARSEAFINAVAQLFTEIMQLGQIPEHWRLTAIKVLFKKGDVKLPGNYRPISILSILYKVFSKVLVLRLKPVLQAARCHDQAGFREGYSCEDHLQTMAIVCEQCQEWNSVYWQWQWTSRRLSIQYRTYR